jgi:arylsulfatase A-like enzyme
VSTPNIDALAEWGIRFIHSYCASPSSSISKASIITGLMPHQTGVSGDGTSPDSSVVNMGQLFREAGYRTIWAGKWFLPEEFPGCNEIDTVQGFEVLNFLSSEKITGRGEDMDTPLSDAIVKVLKRKMNKPFLLVASYLNPQDIKELADRPDAYPQALNPASTPPLPGNFRISTDEPQFLTDSRQDQVNHRELFNTREFTQAQWRNYLHHYYQMTEKIDKEIGKLINVLEYKGLDENTIIIMTSLQGDGAAAHHWAGGNSAYEEAVKVPFILSMFGKTLRNEVDEKHLVSGIDVLPTLLDYAGTDIPEKIEGSSLKAVVENPDTSWRNHLVSEFVPNPDNPQETVKMLRWRDYKYVLYPSVINNEQLFDLTNDPGEMVNLISNPGYYSVRSEMSLLLKRLDEKSK